MCSSTLKLVALLKKNLLYSIQWRERWGKAPPWMSMLGMGEEGGGRVLLYMAAITVG